MTTLTVHDAETPSQAVVRAGARTKDLTAPSGRVFRLRRLSPLHRMQTFEALGGDLSTNFPFVTYALVALSVVSIDGVAERAPQTKLDYMAAVDRIGDDFDAVSEAVANFDPKPAADLEAQVADLKNG